MTHRLLNFNAFMKYVWNASIRIVNGVLSSNKKLSMTINVLFKSVEQTKNFTWIILINKMLSSGKNFNLHSQKLKYLNAVNIPKNKLNSYVKIVANFYVLFACFSTQIIANKLMFKLIRKYSKIQSS